jgi:hypothetical protein
VFSMNPNIALIDLFHGRAAAIASLAVFSAAL